jgi:hypothetical protein
MSLSILQEPLPRRASPLFFFNPQLANPLPPFSPHPSYRVNWKLPLNTGAPPPPRVSPSPPKPAATPVSCHLGELQAPRPCPADSPRPPGALVAAAAAPRPTTHRWQACDRVCRCVMIATHTCRTARHGPASRCGR